MEEKDETHLGLVFHTHSEANEIYRRADFHSTGFGISLEKFWKNMKALQKEAPLVCLIKTENSPLWLFSHCSLWGYCVYVNLWWTRFLNSKADPPFLYLTWPSMVIPRLFNLPAQRFEEHCLWRVTGQRKDGLHLTDGCTGGTGRWVFGRWQHWWADWAMVFGRHHPLTPHC